MQFLLKNALVHDLTYLRKLGNRKNLKTDGNTSSCTISIPVLIFGNSGQK